MAIRMQGSWTVSIKSFENFEPTQRFVIQNADSGNGTYASDSGPVDVNGSNWIIRIQMERNGTFVDEPDEIVFPAVSGGQYHFDIRANIPPEDPVWDDMILTCSTPVSLVDYIIYGNVSYYSEGCIFNPCYFPFMVVESYSALAEALRNPILRAPIETLYPYRLKYPPPPPPGPQPDPPPFVPIVIPLREETAIPPKLAQSFMMTEQESSQGARRKNEQPAQNLAFSSLGTFALSEPQKLSVPFDRIQVTSIIDRLFERCETGELEGVVLRFQEYDRTNAELAGAPYSGMGNRENLGLAATDHNGNYIFRFRRTLSQYINEANVDVAPGENVWTQIMPDVIAQLVDTTLPAGYCYESPPQWNIPFIKQINICVPKGCVGRLPTACQGANAIQAIGNIFIGAPQADGSRVGYNNFLNADGKITAKSSIADTPPARCAAWAGTLDLFACFINHPEVTQYTIRYRPLGETTWKFFQEVLLHPEIALIGFPGYSGTTIGPFSKVMTVDGVPGVQAQVYWNIENNPAYLLTHRDRKAIISSWLYPPVHTTLYGSRQYGPVQFRIEGYDGADNKVAAADDIITLYIDNNPPDFDIQSVTMGGQPSDVCALFHLGGSLNTALTVRFRANQLEGFLQYYSVTMRKGNIGPFLVNNGGPGMVTNTYNHTSDLNCNYLDGTFNDPVHDPAGFVTVNLAPPVRWLEEGQSYCTFDVQLSCATRITNGYNDAIYYYGPREFLLGIQAV